MLKPRSLVSAGVLACLTILVFSVLHDYGPASAIRKFHAAIAANDLSDLQQVIDVPVTDDSVSYLANKWIRPLMARGIQPQVARQDRQQNAVRVAVVYKLPDGDQLAIIWIVDRDKRLWRINTRETASLLARGYQRS
jgi:hypothetical protein